MRAAYRPSAIPTIAAWGVRFTPEADIGDDTGFAGALPVGAEEGGADSRLGVVVVKPGVCGCGLAPWVQAVTPRPTTTEATTIWRRRAREQLMINPSGALGKSRMDPPDITFSPGGTG
jgi:hypothetical protein